MAETRKTMRPRKGDVLITLRDPDGQIQVLIPKENVRQLHLDTIADLSKRLGEMFRAGKTLNESVSGPPTKEPTDG